MKWPLVGRKSFDALQKQVKEIAMDVSKLAPAVQRVVTDFGKLKTDMTAYIAANPPSDPAQQKTVDDLTASLNNAGDSMEALDAVINPPAAV